MRRCNKCGQETENQFAMYCSKSECDGQIEDVIEEKIEEVLPRKAVRQVKRRPFVYVALAIILAVFGVTVSVGLTRANNDLKTQQDVVTSLNVQLQKSDNELQALQVSLSKTEEGRQQLETAKSQVEDQNKQLDARATSAEQTASKAKSDLVKTQSDLSKKQTELAGITNDLSSKQAELDKAKRGIALFDKTESLFTSFDQSSMRITGLFVSAYEEILQENYSNTEYYINQIDSETQNNLNIYNQIKTIFDSIKNGNY